MTDELKFPTNGARPDRDSLDESLVSAIRDVYSPQGGDAYWAGLEQRIMARVTSQSQSEGSWWSVLAPWARPALIAAAAIFAIAGVINQQLVETDDQLSYESAFQSSTPSVVSSSEEIMSVERGADGATLSYYLSH
jgi:anti-sigma factor RsiW